MSRTTLWMIDYRELSWWYWAATAVLLLTGLMLWPPALAWTVLLSAVQTLHFLWRERSVTIFSVQVRFAYTLMVLVFLWEPLQPLLWIPAMGTVAQVLVGYCALARCLSLLPANRRQPFSMKLLLDTFLSRPVRGSVLQGQPSRR
jgi:hypothetical protein